MTTRTFIQQGRGYGSEPVTITVKLDNAIIYQGAVDTLDETPPEYFDPTSDIEVTVFSWTQDVAASGTRELEITVHTGALLITDTIANYTTKSNSAPPPQYISSGPDEYLCFYNTTVGDDVIISDPFLSPAIDGIAIERERLLDDPVPLSGQWTYLVEAGSVFTTPVGIKAGSV